VEQLNGAWGWKGGALSVARLDWRGRDAAGVGKLGGEWRLGVGGGCFERGKAKLAGERCSGGR
jgi:hypothetical protein